MRRIRSLAAVVGVLLVPAVLLALPMVEQAPEPPPTLADAVRGHLAGGYAVSSEPGPAVTLWPVDEVARRDGSAAGLGVAHTALRPGGLLGALSLAGEWTDYRGQAIPAGDYTLRYAVAPEDGCHMGVSFYRDFAVLAPAGSDTEPAPLDRDAVVELGLAAAGAHPAVMALWPADGEEAGALFDNDLGQPTLVTKGGETSLGWVIEGTGEID